MAETMTRLVESGAQDSNHKLMNKIPSNINNHNSNNIKDITTSERSKTSVDNNENIPVNNISFVSSSPRTNEGSSADTLADEYKQRWAIPLLCRLAGGGESALNSNNSNWTATSNNNGAVGASSSNNSNNAAIPTSANWSNSQQTAAASNSSGSANAWSTTPAGNNSGSNSGRQTSSSISSPNNASHQSNTIQNIGKFINTPFIK